MNDNQNSAQVKGTFHTQANLSQALTAVVKRHYESLNSGKQMPPFILEALSLMMHNVASVVDNNLYDLEKWNRISDLPKEVINIIEQAVPAPKKEEGNE
ncbi:hypothetical protein BZG00_15675 [Salinivibrio kushneri]|uniref:Uncharacterized protein n=2 Tax=Pseudomonadota TaxID=1224 RepID=A0A922P2W7_9HYPH|nr:MULTISPECIES: hypothetical protein [Pseudomonadota]YP_008126086.1 hypothetical protein M610_gp066 [Alteromonas phage vB_AmaP_AD45-P1]AGM47050.1 hypothetical protein AD45P3_00560 [Alteromonas phage vB_AmaP_AD45-P3]AGM47166.1 hypothetical protein AD45P4_00555 [Alteromonas phage vB_AmaP_AD45-P4]AGM47288.1 hypothetical protein AD45P2_00585 [Alteromonas phage vB_AmaP_AD45-P2]AGM46933.1 hypothetical protein AD45P1_00575 [Alteromonas phage vB_AmaP_AD45-P1]KEQ05594.1 hypothetical protein GV68_0868